MEPTELDYRPSQAPVGQLKTNRGLLKYILLSVITFGIYGIVLFSSISTDINIIAGRYDGVGITDKTRKALKTLGS